MHHTRAVQSSPFLDRTMMPCTCISEYWPHPPRAPLRACAVRCVQISGSRTQWWCSCKTIWSSSTSRLPGALCSTVQCSAADASFPRILLTVMFTVMCPRFASHLPQLYCTLLYCSVQHYAYSGPQRYIFGSLNALFISY